MRCLIVLLLISLTNSEENNVADLQKSSQELFYPFGERQVPCISDNQVLSAYRAAMDAFAVKLYQNAAPKADYFLILAPYSVWMTLAAIAEGADYYSQQELFKLLYLPQDRCSRQKFYQVAASRITPTNYIRDARVMLIEERLQLEPLWYNLVNQRSLLQVFTAPIKRDPATANRIINRIVPINAHQLDLSGNSVLLNSLDFNTFWTTAFAGAVIERSPFYSHTGRKIGSVDLMRIRRKVRIGYAPSINSKVIELSIGPDHKYSMLFAVVVNDDANIEPAITNSTEYTFSEVLSSLRDTYVPIDIAIPQLVMTSEVNIKDILKDMGVVNVWNNPWATSSISTPPAHPTSYIQRSTLTLDSHTVNSRPYQGPAYAHTTDQELYWNEFIADRPFMFGLADTETYTCLMATMCVRPTYLY